MERRQNLMTSSKSDYQSVVSFSKYLRQWLEWSYSTLDFRTMQVFWESVSGRVQCYHGKVRPFNITLFSFEHLQRYYAKVLAVHHKYSAKMTRAHSGSRFDVEFFLEFIFMVPPIKEDHHASHDAQHEFWLEVGWH